jgi:HPt (histidine-containing phosphotransfer) domain-containing protein
MPLSALLTNAEPPAGLMSLCPELRSTFDLEALFDRCMSDAGLATKLLERFGARLPKSVAEIEQSLAACDRSEMLRQIHTMKGESGSLSAVGLQEAAGNLETLVRDSADMNDPEIARLVSELAAAANLCRRCLPQALTTLASATNDA